MKDPHNIILRPHITERSVAESYGDERAAMLKKRNEAKKGGGTGKKGKAADGPIRVEESDLVRKYTFIVAPEANKIEIKAAIEAIYNAGKKAGDRIQVTAVRTVRLPGKKTRQARATGGLTPDRKKAVVTLAKGQLLEDYGV